MRTKALWRKYRRKVYKCADWLLYISGGFSTLLLLWMILQVTTVAHFVVPTGSMEPTLIPGDRILVNKWVMGARIFDVWKSMEGKERWKRFMKKIDETMKRILLPISSKKIKLVTNGYAENRKQSLDMIIFVANV